MKGLIPRPVEVGREALIVIGGAVLAALVISQLPGLKAWIQRQWGDTPRPF
ncbi:hypothetical protein [Hydrogenophaga sp. PBC]|uniref:hypothetical protein n=1 Tax=Hydrogenophaga sp. PBC TaxID=795665 RepID=UPI000260773A|nr:hypothetical protein [Hydrogenophaga sp. PBC]